MSINIKTNEWAAQKKLSSHYYPEITSTNDVAKSEFPGSKESFALYLTDNQSQGRGRGQNQWQNLADGNTLLSTWCFQIDSPPQPILTPLLGLALYESLFVFDSSLPLRLKAPNDIYLGDGKLAGLLVEVVQQGSQSYILVGLGMNVEEAPQLDIATSCLKDFKNDYRTLWPDFCKYLYNQFQIAIDKGRNSELDEDDCLDLLEALNGDLEEELYHEVSPQGDLHTSTGIISWKDL